jgi:Na+-translocating ferredoxin:NAD+ oxidoreductase RNF subunit RnfB
MIENLIVAIIVGASAVYAARALLPRRARKSCGGCDGCAAPAPTGRRVIKIHSHQGQ